MSIVDDTDHLLDAWLGVQDIGQAPHYRHGRAFTRISQLTDLLPDNRELLHNLLRTFERNWTGQRSTALHNWRFRQQLQYTDNARQQVEIILERQLVGHAGRHWANQVPVASGLAGPNQDKRRAVDVVLQHGEREFTLFELKIASDTPLFAAMEILLHGMLLIFTRQHLAKLGYAQKDYKLLGADVVHLCVLAPRSYYGAYELKMLEASVNDGFAKLCAHDLPFDLAMDFKFEVFPTDFDWTNLRSAANPAGVVDAFVRRRAVYGT